MILIISNESDPSTDEVIDWLIYLGAKLTRINKGEVVKKFVIKINNTDTCYKITFDNKEIEDSKIKSFWYRKSGINIFNDKNLNTISKRKKKFIKFINNENRILEAFIEAILSKKHGIGYVKSKNINKLSVLQTAKECGLLIPKTIITNNRSYVKTNSIIKAISEGIYYRINRKPYITYTMKIYPERLPKKFNSSLFQEMIVKEFEVRIFYLKGKCYSMAIFSQNNSQTKVDFRKYNYNKPNRTVPYTIPESLKQKIINLMEKLEFNTGSIDFLVDTKGKHIFLEVNPSGQFGMTSRPCNYFLEKEIALELMKYEK